MTMTKEKVILKVGEGHTLPPIPKDWTTCEVQIFGNIYKQEDINFILQAKGRANLTAMDEAATEFINSHPSMDSTE